MVRMGKAELMLHLAKAQLPHTFPLENGVVKLIETRKVLQYACQLITAHYNTVDKPGDLTLHHWICVAMAQVNQHWTARLYRHNWKMILCQGTNTTSLRMFRFFPGIHVRCKHMRGTHFNENSHSNIHPDPKLRATNRRVSKSEVLLYFFLFECDPSEC